MNLVEILREAFRTTKGEPEYRQASIWAARAVVSAFVSVLFGVIAGILGVLR